MRANLRGDVGADSRGRGGLLRGGWADLIAGLEYQHIDLGTQLELSPLDGFNPCPPGVNCRSVKATEDIVRFRLSFKINPFAPAGVVARY